MFNHINPKNGQKAPLIADDVFAIIMEVRDETLDAILTAVLLSIFQTRLCLCLAVYSAIPVKALAVCSTLNVWTARSYMTETLTMTTLASRLVFQKHSHAIPLV